MARETHDREDLLRDAHALLPRIELRLQLEDKQSTVVAGFRGESLSLYFRHARLAPLVCPLMV